MWAKNQWLWDKELNVPVKFFGIILRYNDQAVFEVIATSGEILSYPFSTSSFWKSRFTEIYDGSKNILGVPKITKYL